MLRNHEDEDDDFMDISNSLDPVVGDISVNDAVVTIDRAVSSSSSDAKLYDEADSNLMSLIKTEKTDYLEPIFSHVQIVLKEMKFSYKNRPNDQLYSVNLASGTNCTYFIDYIYKNTLINFSMKLQMENINFIFKNEQLNINETKPCFVGTYVEKNIKNEAELNKLLRDIVHELDLNLSTTSAPSIATIVNDALSFNEQQYREPSFNIHDSKSILYSLVNNYFRT
ncbi:unnamed protein product [Adineta steineri]|uniref:Uncharacterized protein n=1 Tax=Adineta steineri TaxID=433720 RepID=A0A819E770_9BILA|nr:unnamed protein product [Adineta steineri]